MTANHSEIGIIILAAGASTRMKEPKQLLKFQGKTLVRHGCETAISANCKSICVVLGANYEKIRREISDLPITIAVNENWRQGMSSSLQTGLKKILETEKKLSGILAMLCDQPLVDKKLLSDLIKDFQEKKSLITACEYADTIGVPAIFSYLLFEEILELAADAGAKSLIKEYADSVSKIYAPQAELDVDTPDDYAKIL